MPEDQTSHETSAPPADLEEGYSDALEEVERLRSQVEKKVLELDQALRRLESYESAGESPPEAPEAPEPVLSGRPRDVAPGSAVEEPDRDQMMIEATQMAFAGSDRTEIEKMLRERYEIRDPASLVDQILGADA